MANEDFDAVDLRKLIELSGAAILSGEGNAALAGFAGLDDLWRHPEPELLPVPASVRGFRIRIDLQRTKPPVWRRIDVSGDISLVRLHDVLQATMGWTDSHLHRFRTGNARNSPEFLTRYDVEEGDEGILEDDVRLDQVVAAVGDRLWYDYDFGDGWEHVLRVEKILDTPPPAPVCVGGKRACPPEDCGGPWGHRDLADWVLSGYDDALRPEVFDTAEAVLAWLPEGWNPEAFDIAETNDALATVGAEPVAVVEELASLLELARDRVRAVCATLSRIQRPTVARRSTRTPPSGWSIPSECCSTSSATAPHSPPRDT